MNKRGHNLKRMTLLSTLSGNLLYGPYHNYFQVVANQVNGPLSLDNVVYYDDTDDTTLNVHHFYDETTVPQETTSADGGSAETVRGFSESSTKATEEVKAMSVVTEAATSAVESVNRASETTTSDISNQILETLPEKPVGSRIDDSSEYVGNSASEELLDSLPGYKPTLETSPPATTEVPTTEELATTTTPPLTTVINGFVLPQYTFKRVNTLLSNKVGL